MTLLGKYLIEVMYLVGVGLGVFVVQSYLGRIQLFHTATSAIVVYAFSICMREGAMPWLTTAILGLSLLLAIALQTVVLAVTSEDQYVAVGVLSVLVLFRVLIGWRGITGGDGGIGLDVLVLRDLWSVLVFGVACTLAIVMVSIFDRSRIARRLCAYRDNARVYSALRADAVPTLAFAAGLATMITVVFAVLHTLYQRRAVPADYDVQSALLLPILLILHGGERPWGAIVGPIAFIVFHVLLGIIGAQALEVPLLYGILVAVVLHRGSLVRRAVDDPRRV